MFDTEAGPFVVANRADHLLRRNFSFAHEYAHVLLDCDSTGRISRASERTDLIEVRANSFAANLLLPEAGIHEVLETLGKSTQGPLLAETPVDDDRAIGIEARGSTAIPRIQMHDVVLLAHHFGVSRQVVLYRLRNLRLISDRELQELLSANRRGTAASSNSCSIYPSPITPKSAIDSDTDS